MQYLMDNAYLKDTTGAGRRSTTADLNPATTE